MVDDDKWDEVQQVLNADLEVEDPESEALYDDMGRYVMRAEVLDSHGDEDTAEYFKELAVEEYSSFVEVTQMKKNADDYDF